MATFKGGTSGQAPLRLQLRTPAGLTARLYSIYAAGENDGGSASRPVLTRPSTLGTGNSLPIFPTSDATPAQSTLSDTFSVGSSLPFVGQGPFALPIIVRWEAPKGAGVVVGAQGADAALLVYAHATGGHLWSAEIAFEEL